MNFDLVQVLTGFFAIVISITIHEFAHAWMANQLGDPTPGRHGRLSLNPMVLWKVEPIGSLIAPLLGAFSGFLFGWASTPVNLSLIRRGIPIRRAEILVAIAGPVSNVMLFILSVGLFAGASMLPPNGVITEALTQFTYMLTIANALLAVFNMIPIKPLDGYTVLTMLLPPSATAGYRRFMEQFGFMALILIFMYGSRAFGPLLGAVTRLLASIKVLVS